MKQAVICQKPFNKQPITEIIAARLSRCNYNALNLPVMCCVASLSLIASGNLLANTVRFSQDQYTFNETQGTVNLQVDLTVSDYGGPCEIELPVLDAPESFNISSFDIATPGNDFTINTNVLRISVTEQDIATYSGNVSLTIHTDDVIEEDESFSLYFGTPVVLSGDCFAEVPLDISESTTVLVENRFTQFSTLTINANPGQRASATFEIDTVVDGLVISSPLETSGLTSVSPGTISSGNNSPVIITYEYNIPADAPVGQQITDTLSIVSANQSASFRDITIPVEINIQAEPSQQITTQTIDDAWNSLCASEKAPAVLCENMTGEELTQKQRRDLSPEELAAMGVGMMNITRNHMKTIFRQQQTRRNRIKAIDLTNISAVIDGQAIPVGRIIDSYYNPPETGGSAGETSIGTPWSFFMTGRYNNGEKNASRNDDGFDFDSSGVTLGGDYRLSGNLFLGGAFGYANMNSDFANNGGNLDADDILLTFYGIYNADLFHVDWSLHYGQVGFGFTRKIDSFSTETKGDTDADKYALSIAFGMDYNHKAWLLAPYMRLDYINTSIDSFQETGGSGLALDIRGQDITSTTTALGGNLSHAFSMKWGILALTSHVEWIHEYNDDDRSIVAAFAADPSVLFSTPVDNPDKDFFAWSFGLSAVFSEGRSLFINYEGISLQRNRSNNTFYIGGRMDL